MKGNSQKTTVKWKLREYLDANGISAYAVMKEANLSNNGLYAITGGNPRVVGFDTLGAVIEAVSNLTGKSVKLDDVLEIVVVDEDNPEYPRKGSRIPKHLKQPKL